MSPHLLILLVLLAVVGAASALPPGERPDARAVDLERLPTALGGWSAVNGVPEHVLPADPRALVTLRRTYAADGHHVMVSIARYPAWNHPDHRPLFDFIAPAAAGEVTLDRVALPGDGPGSPPVSHIPALQLEPRAGGPPLVVAYWYQLDDEVITSEYGLRWRLFLDTLRGRPRVFVLVRLAAVDGAGLARFFASAYPPLRELLAP
jgi:hypothetical protein